MCVCVCVCLSVCWGGGGRLGFGVVVVTVVSRLRCLNVDTVYVGMLYSTPSSTLLMLEFRFIAISLRSILIIVVVVVPVFVEVTPEVSLRQALAKRRSWPLIG